MSIKLTNKQLNINNYLSSEEAEAISVNSSWLPENHQNKYAIEIIKNWRYNPSDKIALEYGKLLKEEGNLEEALIVLNKITTKLNADWRAVYRSFHLLSKIYDLQSQKDKAKKYRELCLRSNHKFPVN
tara:strand:- start:301 stop:684 length:384 start_codon:yes stop_codon:yes gene_type:complete